MPAEWESADAWVFAAIAGRDIGSGSSLADVIAKGDAINHAILTEEEFTRAVPRLVNAGVVGADLAADRYWFTDAGYDMYVRCTRRRGLFGWIEAVPRALHRLGPPQDGKWSLRSGVFTATVRSYVARFGP